MPKRMLVIIDPQNDFTHPEGDYARRHAGVTQIAEARLGIINLLRSFDGNEAVIVRSDFKPEQFGHGLFLCIPGTFGHKIDADLQVDGTLNIVTKTAHSCFSSEAFNELLNTGKTDTLILCGFLAEYCVKQTAIDALLLGYKVVLVEDCIATGDDVQSRKEQALAELMEKGAGITGSKGCVEDSNKNSNRHTTGF